MLREKWSTLEQRRNEANLIVLHKLQKTQVNVDHSHQMHKTTNFLLPTQNQTPQKFILSSEYTT